VLPAASIHILLIAILLILLSLSHSTLIAIIINRHVCGSDDQCIYCIPEHSDRVLKIDLSVQQGADVMEAVSLLEMEESDHKRLLHNNDNNNNNNNDDDDDEEEEDEEDGGGGGHHHRRQHTLLRQLRRPIYSPTTSLLANKLGLQSQLDALPLTARYTRYPIHCGLLGLLMMRMRSILTFISASRFLLSLFIYSSPSISFSFLHYTLIVISHYTHTSHL
jgi:hypothetical protein